MPELLLLLGKSASFPFVFLLESKHLAKYIKNMENLQPRKCSSIIFETALFFSTGFSVPPSIATAVAAATTTVATPSKKREIEATTGSGSAEKKRKKSGKKN